MSKEVLLSPVSRKRVDSIIANKPQVIGLHAPAGTGKGTVATMMVAKLLDVERDKVQKHPYVISIDAQTDKVGIDTIRELQKTLSTKVPSSAQINRAVILEKIDKLGHEAQNALLKLLEEPPDATIVVVTLDNKKNVLPTILSRLQMIEIVFPSQDLAYEHFSGNHTPQRVSSAYNMSQGRVGLMYSMLEEAQAGTQLQSIDRAKELLRLSRYERLCRIDTIIKQQDINVTELLECTEIILKAIYDRAIGKGDNKALSQAIMRLDTIGEALNDVEMGVNGKLILSRLYRQL